MTQKELHSYRLTSMEEPTEEMLEVLMKEVAKSARDSSERAKSVVKQYFERIKAL